MCLLFRVDDEMEKEGKASILAKTHKTMYEAEMPWQASFISWKQDETSFARLWNLYIIPC